MTMINTLYSRHYNVTALRASPTHAGHAGVARNRVYLILTLKGAVTQIHDPQSLYRKISEYITQFVQTEPKDYLVSTNFEYYKEASRMAIKRGIRVRTFHSHKYAPRFKFDITAFICFHKSL